MPFWLIIDSPLQGARLVRGNNQLLITALINSQSVLAYVTNPGRLAIFLRPSGQLLPVQKLGRGWKAENRILGVNLGGKSVPRHVSVELGQ